MRRLSDDFMECLLRGFLAPLRQRAIEDKDLDLEIRDRYLNIYYKGNSLLKLDELHPGQYRPTVHPKFLDCLSLADLTGDASVNDLLSKIGPIKENIVQHGKSSLEIEYEQLIIRANNREPRNNSDYFVVDRQYTTSGRDRFDLLGFHWSRDLRHRGQEVAPCLMEVKFALNDDIGEVHEQLERYYEIVRPRAAQIAEEAEGIFRQKLALGLYEQSRERLEAMRTLMFARDIRRFQFILILIDYNPNSGKLCLDKLGRLPFADQVRVFHSGFAMWRQSVVLVSPVPRA